MNKMLGLYEVSGTRESKSFGANNVITGNFSVIKAYRAKNEEDFRAQARGHGINVAWVELIVELTK